VSEKLTSGKVRFRHFSIQGEDVVGGRHSDPHAHGNARRRPVQPRPAR
jgi:hypothetical protein